MAEIKKLRERCEIPEQYTWNTTDIFPSDEAWQQAYDEAKALIPQLAAYAGKLGASAANVYEYTELMLKTEEAIGMLSNYAQRKYDQDTRVPTYQAMAGKVMSLWVELSGATSFDTPELLKIDDETMEKFFADEPRLELYRRYF
jgi:oligoendopeptidase F